MSASENNLNYTDGNHVDEDSKNITNQGGAWPDAAVIGIMYRNMYDSSVNISSIFVASLKNKNSLSQ